MFKLLIAATLLVGALSHPVSNGGGRVVNGTDAKWGEVPYIVSIRAYGSHSCGGSLIATNWVLTAAHCSQGAVSSMSIQYGVLEISSSGNVLNVLSKIVHEKYDPWTIKDDIALLKLDGHVTLSENVALVNLPAQNQAVPGWSDALLAGWGLPYSGGSVMKRLQRVDILAYPQDECIKAHGAGSIFEGNICGGVPEGGKGQCSGDSGGPLTVGGTQVGLVSWSVKPCTIRGYPGVYTRVPFYRDWIKENSGV